MSTNGERIEQVRARVAQLAINLQAIISPLDVATSLIGAGVTVLEHDGGREIAVRYLRLLADELEQDPTQRVGHA